MMPSGEKFRLFVIGCLAFVVSLFVIWVFVLDEPFPSLVKEIPDDEIIDRIAEYKENQKKWDEIWESGSVPEDAATAKIRNNVLTTLERLKGSPCDTALRKDYIEAVEEFDKDRRDRTSRHRIPSESSEVIAEAGMLYDLSIKYDEPIVKEIISSASEGYLLRKNSPEKIMGYLESGEAAAGGAGNVYAACASEQRESLPEPPVEEESQDEEIRDEIRAERTERVEEFREDFLRENRREIEELEREREMEMEEMREEDRGMEPD